MQLKGKIAIITGGGSGFGASIADLFAKNGAKVIVADLNLDGARKISEKIGAHPIKVDVSNAKSVEKMKIDVFVSDTLCKCCSVTKTCAQYIVQILFDGQHGLIILCSTHCAHFAR